METRASHVLIGSFALGIVVLAVLSILWLGKLTLDREWDHYDIVFGEAVTGLGQGGAVEYNGIQVGEVRSLSLDPMDPSRVVAHVRITAGTPIKVDTRAKLTYTGLTGVSIIQLSGGTPQAARLRPPEGAEAAVIVADASALQNLLASGEGLAANADRVLLQMLSLLRDENVAALGVTLANLETISGSIAGRSDEIGRALTDIAAVSHQLRDTLDRTDRLLATLDATAESARGVMDDDVPVLVEQARATLAATQRASERLALLLDENHEAISTFSNQGLAEVAPAIRELRATLKPLRELAERLESEPGLLLQPPSQLPEHAPP